ncbi:MAG: YraN family protein [Candidatus Moranbacteria bacterium CG23_combo_of_CG06-09_8_20_14_all_39_10]|nr:MAG: YraN family protein [Candidatus Moranbacteria bacterium CG23_combo_of_CG06-09_8_20_14_all_39_10]
MSDKNSTGQTGEQVAANFLKNKGYEILDMNFENDSGRRLGEIDIVARDKQQDEIVFVEVKTREYNRYKDTLPEENINYQKLRKLAKIATVFLRERKMEDCDYRFDAISVWLDYTTRMAKIKHLPNIFL